MSSQTKAVLIALLLAVTLPLAGCSGLTDGDTDGDTEPESDDPNVDGEQLRTASLDAMAGVETARLESETTLEFSSRRFTSHSEGVIDLAERKLRVTTNSSVGGQDFAAQNYLINDTIYLHSETLDGWTKQELPAFETWNKNQFSQQQRLLENATVEVTDRKTVDGHEVYVSELAIEGEAITEAVSRQSGDISTQLNSGSLENVSVTQHIDVETNRVRYTKLEYAFSEDGQEVSMVIEQRFSEFNEPVEIELPEGAESAEPIGESVDR